MRSMGRQIADVSTYGQSCSDLDPRSLCSRLSTGSAPAPVSSTADIGHSVGRPDSSKAAD